MFFRKKEKIKDKERIVEFRVGKPIISSNGKKFYPCIYWAEGFRYQYLVTPAEYFEDKEEAQSWCDEKNRKTLE